jgi:hypothetical protein
VQDRTYLANIIAAKDVNELSSQDIHTTSAPHLVFTIEHMIGERDCVVIDRNSLQYAAQAKIENTQDFTDALIDYASTGEEIFFEADYSDFSAAFPFAIDASIDRIGILVIPSAEGYRFQTLTLLDDGELRHDPYYMFLPLEGVESARAIEDSDEYSHQLFEAMVVEHPDAPPTPGTPRAKIIEDSIPVSATLATIGISFLAMKSECEATSEADLPVLQQEHEMPRIVSLSVE